MSKKILSLLAFATVALTALSCSDDESNPSTDQDQDTTVNERILEVKYPRTGVYSMDPEKYHYDDDGKINKIEIQGGVTVYDVTYGTDLISMNLVKHNYSGFISFKKRTNFHLADDKVDKVVTETVGIGASNTISFKDSIVYSYDKEYLASVVLYELLDGQTTYRQAKKVDFIVEDGNIVKSVTKSYDKTIETLYSYDKNSRIEYGDFVYEAPVFKDTFTIGYMLIKNYLGKKNKNNVVSMTNVFEESQEPNNYIKTLNYDRKIDEFGRLIEISMVGSGYNHQEVSIDTKTEFIY